MIGNAETQNGRRKRITAEAQALPLFMSAGRSRVLERVAMSAATSREMQKYLRWASDLAGVGRDEAQVLMLDRALGDYFKKDETWQAQKAAAGGDDETVGDQPAGRTAAAAPGASTPPRPAAPPASPRPGTENDPTSKPGENGTAKGK